MRSLRMNSGIERALALSCAVCVLIGGMPPSVVAKAVPRTALTTLCLAPYELPAPLILGDSAGGVGEPTQEFRELSRTAIRHNWYGPLDLRSKSSLQITTTLAVAGSSEQALDTVRAEMSGISVIIPEVTGDEALSAFSDQAWWSAAGSTRRGRPDHSSRMLFVRHNVAVSVSVFSMKGGARETALNLAELLGQRIDAAAAGKPLPAPILPPSVEDMRCRQEEVWDAYQAVRAFGKNATTIVVRNSQGELRAVPAYIDNGSYMVPLRYLVAATHPGTRVKVDRVATDVTWSGRHLVFAKRDAKLTVDGKAALLRKPAVVKRGQIMVPLSIVETVLGRQITWSTSQGKKMARF